MSTTPFWMVWGIHSGPPTFQHQSEESARNEAERLARLNPGKQFVVLESVAAYTKTDVAVTDLRPNIIPF